VELSGNYPSLPSVAHHTISFFLFFPVPRDPPPPHLPRGAASQRRRLPFPNRCRSITLWSSPENGGKSRQPPPPHFATFFAPCCARSPSVCNPRPRSSFRRRWWLGCRPPASCVLVEIGPEGWTPTQQPPELSPSLRSLPRGCYFYLR
jgi:hypothetical protein